MPLFAGPPIAVRYIVKYMQGVFNKVHGVRWAVRALLLWLTSQCNKDLLRRRKVYIQSLLEQHLTDRLQFPSL
jgi:hypothetical protein